jgi:hypothetical protein
MAMAIPLLLMATGRLTITIMGMAHTMEGIKSMLIMTMDTMITGIMTMGITTIIMMIIIIEY